jgi:hypothetical protein
MPRRHPHPEVLVLRPADRAPDAATIDWRPLTYALFGTIVTVLLMAVTVWNNIPVAAKRDAGAARACQLHIRYKLPPEPGLEMVSLAIQPATGLPGAPRSVLIAWRAKGVGGSPTQGMQQCAFLTGEDGNFPEFKRLTRAVFRSEMEMQDWKARFLAGEDVPPLPPERPDCCLPIDGGASGDAVPPAP